MAYAALIALEQTLGKIFHPTKQVKSLVEKVGYVLEFLENASEKWNFTFTDLEGKMRDAAYEGEDIIENYLSIQSTTSFGEIKDLQKVIQEFDFIWESVLKIKDGKVIEPQQPARKSLTTGAGPSRISSGEKGDMVGLDGDFIQIKDQLTGSSSHLKIISIVGMGGIGKTTLATNLYTDSLIDYHFDLRGWVTVSQSYNCLEILRHLLISMRHVKGESQDHDEMRIDQFEENLYKSLKGRRYLIVMDDVWDTKAWDDVKRFFPDDNNGSRIVLTTPLSEVALYVNSDHDSIHRMNLLSWEESWNLLRAKVYGEESCPSEFEEIGKKIAWNCRGLPLTIVVVGGILSKGRRTQDYWEYIARNVMSAVTRNDDQLMDILSLSYYNLPHHLKPYFLYMGVFPEDEEILVSRLINLFVAEGFLKLHHSKSLEEVAYDCLKDLIDRNLVMAGKQNHHGGIKTCIIHDLLRDLCIKRAREEKFHVVLGRTAHDLTEVGCADYRISIHSRTLPVDIHGLRARSFLYFAENYSGNLSSFFGRFRLLKVLDALAIKFYEFPSEIVELINLRYLAFACSNAIVLPSAILKLQNLQTLILGQWRYDYMHLPSEIWKMPQLRHLSFKRGLLPYPSFGQFDSENSFDMLYLYTLSNVENFICKKEVFEIMPNLKKLGISYVFNGSREWSFLDFNSFVYLRKLETLKISFDGQLHWNMMSTNFGFPSQLKKLTLSGCRMSWNNMTIVGSLPNLQVLKLKKYSFEGPVWEPNEEEFLELKFLQLQMISLEDWEANEMHFPNLEHLIVYECFTLAKIPSAIGNIPTLQIVEVDNSNDSVLKSVKLIEEEQQSLGNDSLQVRVTSLKYKL